MAKDRPVDRDDILSAQQIQEGVIKKLNELEKTLNARFDRLKQVITDYLNLGSDFAKGSLITALKQV